MLGLQHSTWNRITQKHQWHKSIVTTHILVVCSSSAPYACFPHTLPTTTTPTSHFCTWPHPLPLDLLLRSPLQYFLLDSHCHYHCHRLGQPQHPPPPKAWFYHHNQLCCLKYHNKMNHFIHSEVPHCHLGAAILVSKHSDFWLGWLLEVQDTPKLAPFSSKLLCQQLHHE